MSARRLKYKQSRIQQVTLVQFRTFLPDHQIICCWFHNKKWSRVWLLMDWKSWADLSALLQYFTTCLVLPSWNSGCWITLVMLYVSWFLNLPIWALIRYPIMLPFLSVSATDLPRLHFVHSITQCAAVSMNLVKLLSTRECKEHKNIGDFFL